MPTHPPIDGLYQPHSKTDGNVRMKLNPTEMAWLQHLSKVQNRKQTDLFRLFLHREIKTYLRGQTL